MRSRVPPLAAPPRRPSTRLCSRQALQRCKRDCLFLVSHHEHLSERGTCRPNKGRSPRGQRGAGSTSLPAPLAPSEGVCMSYIYISLHAARRAMAAACRCPRGQLRFFTPPLHDRFLSPTTMSYTRAPLSPAPFLLKVRADPASTRGAVSPITLDVLADLVLRGLGLFLHHFSVQMGEARFPQISRVD